MVPILPLTLPCVPPCLSGQLESLLLHGLSWGIPDGCKEDGMEERQRSRVVFAGARQLVGRLPSHYDLRGWSITTDREILAEALTSGADALLLLDATTAEMATWLLSLHETCRCGNIWLVGTLTPESVRKMWDVHRQGVTVILWDEVDKRLAPLLSEMRADVLAAFGHRLMNELPVSPLTRSVIKEICQSRTPPTSVTAVASWAGVSEATLRSYWNRDIPGTMSLKRLLSWATLIRAIEMKASGSWERVSFRLDLHRRTLERTAQRLVGVTITEAVRSVDAIHGAFAAYVAKTALGESADLMRRTS